LAIAGRAGWPAKTVLIESSLGIYILRRRVGTVAPRRPWFGRDRRAAASGHRSAMSRQKIVFLFPGLN